MMRISKTTKLSEKTAEKLIQRYLENEEFTSEKEKQLRDILKENTELGLGLTWEAIKWALEEVQRDSHQTKRKFYPKENFKDFNEAQDYAVQRNGVCDGVKEFWELKIDPFLDKRLQAKRKKEEEEMKE